MANTNPLVTIAKTLEERVAVSPLAKFSNADFYQADMEGGILNTFLFARPEDMETAKVLEGGYYASGTVDFSEYSRRYPKVPFLIVTAMYFLPSEMMVTMSEEMIVSDAVRLLLPDFVDKLTELRLTLCHGADKYVSTPDGMKHVGNVLFEIAYSLSNTGAVPFGRITRSLEPHMPELSVTKTDSVVDAFEKMERYVVAHS